VVAWAPNEGCGDVVGGEIKGIALALAGTAGRAGGPGQLTIDR